MLRAIRLCTSRIVSIKKIRGDIVETRVNNKGRSLHPSEYVWVDFQTSVMELDIILTKIMIIKPILLAVTVGFFMVYYKDNSTFFAWLSAAPAFVYVLVLFWQNSIQSKKSQLSERLDALLN